MKRNFLTKLTLFGFVLMLSLTFVQCGSKNNTELEKALETLVKTINKQCPIRVDSIMQLDSCVAKEKELTFYYTVTEDGIFDAEIFDEIAVPTIKDNLKNNSQLDFFRKHNVSMKYIYSDNNRNKLYELFLTTNDITKN